MPTLDRRVHWTHYPKAGSESLLGHQIFREGQNPKGRPSAPPFSIERQALRASP
jgi:hypothetical protein